MRLPRIAVILCICALSACSGIRGQAVPGCPYCGDPVTHDGPDGHAEVVQRWRLATWTPPATDVDPRKPSDGAR